MTAIQDIIEASKIFYGLVDAHLPHDSRGEMARLKLADAIQDSCDVVRDREDLERIFDKPAACDTRE